MEISECQKGLMVDQILGAQGFRSHVVEHNPIHVPWQYSTIKKGIAAACPGEIVMIETDTYVEAPMTINKRVILQAVNGPVEVVD